jgi:hypothetical protein
LTVDPASADPLMLIVVALLGEAGLMLGVPGFVGAIESFVKLAELEQDEALPAASVAVAA